MPIKDKTMSIIRFRPNSQSSLQALFEDIFYRDKSGNLVNSALLLYDRIRKEGLRASEWQKHISEVFKVLPTQAEETSVIESLSKKHLGQKLRGKKPYQTLLEMGQNGQLRLSEKEVSVLGRVSGWHSAVSTYYSIINKLKAIGMIDKKDGQYISSERFLDRLRSIEKSLQEPGR
jgi:hypothetical protein